MTGRSVKVQKIQGLSGKEYTVYLEFAETSQNAGEEIRNLLKEKAMAKWTGMMQKEWSMPQSSGSGKEED